MINRRGDNFMNVEIEIKVKVSDFNEIKKILKSKRANFVKKVHQVDEFYVPIHRDFFAKKEPTEWLRIRKNGDKSRFEYDRSKDIGTPKEVVHEYEIEISNAKTLRQILVFLDFKSRYTIDKVREYRRLGDYEFCLDKVKGLGNFLEVELVNNRSGKTFSDLYKFIDKLDIKYQKYPFRSYVSALRDKKGET